MDYLNIALIAATDFSMFLSSINQTYLYTTLLLFIYNAKSKQCLRICVTYIPVNRGSQVDACIVSRLA